MEQRNLFIILGIGLMIISILQIITSTKIAKGLAVIILIIGLVLLLGRKGLDQIWLGVKRSFNRIKHLANKDKSKEETKGRTNICKECGSKLKPNAKFCNECGEKQ